MTSETTPIPAISKLMITQESVLRIVELIYDIKGLEVAMANFEQMNTFFSTEPGWAEAAVEVYSFFAMKRKEEKQQSRAEKLEEQRAGAPHLVVMSQATSDAKVIDKMDVDVNSPGNNIAKIIKRGENHEN